VLKNAATKIALFAFNRVTSDAQTGDAANLTAYLSKNYGAVAQLADTTATELDPVNARGWYVFDVSAAETNATACLFTGKSSTSNVAVVGMLIFPIRGDQEGSIPWQYTVTNALTGDPLPDVAVRVTSDAGGATVIASGITNDAGTVSFFLDAASQVYVWRQKGGWVFTNPDIETVA
jgi:hypothetical protein